MADNYSPLYSPVSGSGTKVSSGGKVYQFNSSGSWTPIASSSTSSPAVGTPAYYGVGQVLGASSSGGSNMDRSQNPGEGWFRDAADGWKQSGDSGVNWDAYFSALDDQLNSLGTQKASQEQVAQNTYQQGMNTLQDQYDTGMSDIEKNKTKTLRDLTQNMIQAWQQGNAMLGTRGASDSSAAKQYSYALTKYGNQQRGDVQSQYSDQMFKLQNIFNTETNNLKLALDNQLQSIAQWFVDAQNSLKNVIGSAKLQQSQEAYNYAQQMMDRAYQEASSRRAALDQWALNRANSYSEAARALGFTANQNVATPTFNNLFGSNTGSKSGTTAGYGYSTEKDIYGNPIV